MSELFKVVEGIELDSIGEIISEGRYAAPVQDGPLRWVDKEHRCASRGCSSPTYCKLKGIPYCMMHSMRLMNEMLIELGVSQ